MRNFKQQYFMRDIKLEKSMLLSQCIFVMKMENPFVLSKPKEYKEVDLSNNCIFALPWRSISVISTVNMLSEIDFEYIEGSHGALYFNPYDVCYVHNGIHSISAGMHFKKGKIVADYCDITPLFSNISTDGASWYNIHTNTVIEELCDFRIGLLFEVAKMKYNVEIQKRSYTNR